MTTEVLISMEKHDSAGKLIGFMDLQTLDTLLDENIKLLEEKLEQFRHEFNTQFYGYSPEFFSDILFVKNLKIKTKN